ncbi:hypothetical protein Mx9_p41 [Myxococcus phage Mx9]|nr:hypothetical protein Mx9_p41 [Myxococcus phage Mx9]
MARATACARRNHEVAAPNLTTPGLRVQVGKYAVPGPAVHGERPGQHDNFESRVRSGTLGVFGSGARRCSSPSPSAHCFPRCRRVRPTQDSNESRRWARRYLPCGLDTPVRALDLGPVSWIGD